MNCGSNAEYLLKSTSASVDDVATSVGYTDGLDPARASAASAKRRGSENIMSAKDEAV